MWYSKTAGLKRPKKHTEELLDPCRGACDFEEVFTSLQLSQFWWPLPLVNCHVWCRETGTCRPQKSKLIWKKRTYFFILTTERTCAITLVGICGSTGGASSAAQTLSATSDTRGDVRHPRGWQMRCTTYGTARSLWPGRRRQAKIPWGIISNSSRCRLLTSAPRAGPGVWAQIRAPDVRNQRCQHLRSHRSQWRWSR